jgi:hypothetical protein
MCFQLQFRRPPVIGGCIPHVCPSVFFDVVAHQCLFFGEARSNPQKSSQSRISSPIRNWDGSPFFTQATRASVRSWFPGFSIHSLLPEPQASTILFTCASAQAQRCPPCCSDRLGKRVSDLERFSSSCLRPSGLERFWLHMRIMPMD